MVQQTFPSGINKEQAFSYHIFSLEFFLLAGLEGERLGSPFSTSYKNSVKNMIEVIPSLVDEGGNLPRYGDSDEGMALQLRPLNSSRLDWLYRLGRSWLNARVPLPEEDSGQLAATVIWAGGNNEGDEDPKPLSSVGFKDAGIFVLTSRRNTPQEIFCLADAGPLGYLSIAAHGHADALSFTLNVGGTPIIVDPGTYIYHADPEWRDYFRSTKAHNTVMVDGLDQSESGGPFLWVKKACCRVIKWEPGSVGGFLAAEHDGYKRLKDPVIHQRQLSLEENRLEVRDELRGNRKHSVEWRLHFSPECQLKVEDSCCQVDWEQGSLKIFLDNQMNWRLVRGDQDGGWYSPGFNLKEPAFTLIGSMVTPFPLKLSSSITLSITGN